MRWSLYASVAPAAAASRVVELVGVPEVVLIGHGDVGRGGRSERQRALEVVVEVQPLRRARHHEARVPRHGLLDRGEALGARTVVRDDAHPVPVRLRPDRVELAPEQLERRLVRGHADRDERPAPGSGSAGSAGSTGGPVTAMRASGAMRSPPSSRIARSFSSRSPSRARGASLAIPQKPLRKLLSSGSSGESGSVVRGADRVEPGCSAR